MDIVNNYRGRVDGTANINRSDAEIATTIANSVSQRYKVRSRIYYSSSSDLSQGIPRVPTKFLTKLVTTSDGGRQY